MHGCATPRPQQSLRLCLRGRRQRLEAHAPTLLPRNLLVLGLVLGHGFRRLLPPYGAPPAPGADVPEAAESATA